MASKSGRQAANSNSSGGSVSSLGSCDMNSGGQLQQPKQQHHLLTTGTITVTTSTPNSTQRLRSHTTSDVTFYSSTETPTSVSGLLRSTTTAAASSSSAGAGGHLWNVDLTDLSYLTHMQRVRARASFARQMSSNSSTTSERSRRRESIAAVNFPVHLTASGTGLNFLGASKCHDYLLF